MLDTLVDKPASNGQVYEHNNHSTLFAHLREQNNSIAQRLLQKTTLHSAESSDTMERFTPLKSDDYISRINGLEQEIERLQEALDDQQLQVEEASKITAVQERMLWQNSLDEVWHRVKLHVQDAIKAERTRLHHHVRYESGVMLTLSDQPHAVCVETIVQKDKVHRHVVLSAYYATNTQHYTRWVLYKARHPEAWSTPTMDDLVRYGDRIVLKSSAVDPEIGLSSGNQGGWRIEPAQGKEEGEVVQWGDAIHLKILHKDEWLAAVDGRLLSSATIKSSWTLTRNLVDG